MKWNIFRSNKKSTWKTLTTLLWFLQCQFWIYCSSIVPSGVPPYLLPLQLIFPRIVKWCYCSPSLAKYPVSTIARNSLAQAMLSISTLGIFSAHLIRQKKQKLFFLRYSRKFTTNSEKLSYSKPSRPNPGRREEINVNFHFHNSLWCLKGFLKALKTLS